jgi:hypothetical protein
MSERYWYDLSLQPLAADGLGAAAQRDDDEVLDDWLASMTSGQFEQILNFLVDRLGGSRSTLDRPVA